MRSQHYLRILGTLAVTALIVIDGCDKKSNPADSGPQAITESNLFPFAVGRKLVYNEVMLDAATGTARSGSDQRHTIHCAAALTRSGKSAFLLVDSTYESTGVTVDSSYVAVEGGNLYMDFDGLWLLVFDKSKGTETQYVAGVYSMFDPSIGFPLTITLKATIHNKQDITTPMGTFSAYKFDLVGTTTLGGNVIEVPQFLWLADGISIVKLQNPVTTDPVTKTKQDGSEMQLVSKNF